MNRSQTTMLWVAIISAIGAFAHLPAVFLAEITGEDELLFDHVSHSMLAVMLQVPGAWRDIFSFYYPPLQSLLSAPLIALFGTSEWTLRLPGALCGLTAAVLLFLTIDQPGGFSRRAAFLAGLLTAAAGVVANHHYALTGGVFSFGGAICALGLARFVDANEEAIADSWLLVGSAGFAWMIMTLPDGFFYLPVLAGAYLVQRGCRITPKVWWGVGLIVTCCVSYAFCYLWLPTTWQEEVSGAGLKVQAILSKLGALRVRDLMWSFAAGSSWIMLAFAPVLLPFGWSRASRGLRWVVFFYAFPLALWTLVFDYPNVRSAHMLLAFPAYALLWSLGAMRLLDLAWKRSKWLGVFASSILSMAVLSAFWQTAVLHITDVPDRRMGPSWLVLRDYYPQGRKVVVLGQHASGWWMRNHTGEGEGVTSNMGGAFSDYYSRRPYFSSNMIDAYLRDPGSARRDGNRYYAHSIHFDSPTAYSLDEVPVVIEVIHRGQSVLTVYDLWRESHPVNRLDASDGRRLFSQEIRPRTF